MQSNWMNQLFSKRAEFEKKVMENWSHAQELVEDKLWQNLKVFFEVKGFRPHIVDFMSYVEKWSPQMTREALSYFLDFFRASTIGMGLRVAKLSDTQAELVIPNRPRNLDEDGQFLESALITGGIENLKLLWLRHAPIGEFHFKILKINFEKLNESLELKNSNSYRVKYELPSEVRESVLSELRINQKTKVQAKLNILDEKDIINSEIVIDFMIAVAPLLADHSKENESQQQ